MVDAEGVRDEARQAYRLRKATVAVVDQLNSVPSTHIRCRMTASPVELADLLFDGLPADFLCLRVTRFRITPC
jgi:hypothetical protein